MGAKKISPGSLKRELGLIFDHDEAVQIVLNVVCAAGSDQNTGSTRAKDFIAATFPS